MSRFLFKLRNFELLEPYDAKVSCTVLRGESSRKGADLLDNANVHFKLSNNIDLTSYLAAGGAGHNDGAGWNPIGNASNKFSGTLNGAGFKITGLWINRSGTDYIGLFGNADGANISNLGIEIAASGVSGGNYLGGLAGTMCKYHYQQLLCNR